MPPLSERHQTLLALLWRMNDLGALPGAGGLLDQDVGLMDELAEVAASRYWQEVARAWPV